MALLCSDAVKSLAKIHLPIIWLLKQQWFFDPKMGVYNWISVKQILKYFVKPIFFFCLIISKLLNLINFSTYLLFSKRLVVLYPTNRYPLAIILLRLKTLVLKWNYICLIFSFKIPIHLSSFRVLKRFQEIDSSRCIKVIK